MTTITLNEKWIDAENASFKESIDPTTGRKTYSLTTMVIPFGKISRNGIMYNKESIMKTMDQIKGKNLHHNHITDGAKTLSRGEWMEFWVADDGLYAKSKVYDTTYNRDYIEWLKSASNIKVSLNVTGDAKQMKDSNNKYYQEAYIKNWREISTVNIPGFVDAEATFAVAMMEKFKSIDNTFIENVQKIIDKYV